MAITIEKVTPQAVLELAQQLSTADRRWLAETLREELDDALPESATLDEAIALYLADKCSLGRAAELAGVTRWDLQDILYERGIPTNGGHDLSDDEVDAMMEAAETRYGHRQ